MKHFLIKKLIRVLFVLLNNLSRRIDVENHFITIPVTNIVIDGRLSEALQHLEVYVRSLESGGNFEQIKKQLDKIDFIRFPKRERKDYNYLDNLKITKE